MAVRIDVVPETEATGEVAELYEDLRGMFFGFVPDVFKLVSSRPDILGAFVAGYRSMFGGGVLAREVKEVVALTVAKTASCEYCTTAHDVLLRLSSSDVGYADAVASGSLDDPAIPEDIRALAVLARDISDGAHRITEERLGQVRSHGWSQAQLIEAVWVACLFNGIVRLVDTFDLHFVGQLEDERVTAP